MLTLQIKAECVSPDGSRLGGARHCDDASMWLFSCPIFLGEHKQKTFIRPLNSRMVRFEWAEHSTCLVRFKRKKVASGGLAARSVFQCNGLAMPCHAVSARFTFVLRLFALTGIGFCFGFSLGGSAFESAEGSKGMFFTMGLGAFFGVGRM